MCWACCRPRSARRSSARPRPIRRSPSEIESWNEQLSPLLLDAPEVEPPADLFDRIKAAIAASAKPQAALAPAAARCAPDEGRWEPLCPGIERKMLWHDREKGRITFLIRAQPGAEFPRTSTTTTKRPMSCPAICASTISCSAPATITSRAPACSHPVARTKGGCMLLMTAAA